MFVKILVAILMVTFPLYLMGQSFGSSGLAGESLNNPTSLQFGPDGRLYTSQQNGLIFVFDVTRNGPNDYEVSATEVIDLVQRIPNHDDDGGAHATVKRQITGILVVGTAANPVLYATSSDYRIGGGGSGNDKNLDTNSGIISRLTRTASGWEKVDLVRGLPRSEENHATNGLQLDAAANILYVAQGGHTNAGAPSNNFAFSTEYALSCAILTVDLSAIDALVTLTDPVSGEAFKYDLPTLDDPTRANVNGRDVNDPFGGNDGLNQARIVPGGPVQVYSPGYRNAYDVLLTESGRLYTWDNGANGGWGGHPENENTPNVTNNWVPGEPGSVSSGPNDAKVNNLDGLHLITGPGYYGGHPNPIRANPAGAGLFTNDQPGGENGVFRTQVTSDPSTTLPVDWPPLPNIPNLVEADFRNPGVDDGALFTYTSSTNGLDEYRTDNFNGALRGDLLAATFNGKILRVKLNSEGTIDGPEDVVVFAENFGAVPLDVTALGPDDPFPGTVWAATYGSDNITIFEPNDYDTPTEVCLGEDLATVDDDDDGYTNADELANGSDPCNGASRPADFDGSLINGFKVSDLNDPDDDDDGIDDHSDAFAWDAANGLGNTYPLDYPFLNGDPGFGFFGLGFTGLMTNGTDYLDLIRDENNSSTEIIAGGAVGLFTINNVTTGTARGGQNLQYNGFQFGLDVNSVSTPFDVEVAVLGPVFNGAPEGEQAVGFYVGAGDQDNYLSISVSAAGGSPVIEIVQENAGFPVVSTYPDADLLQASQIRLFLHVDPANGTVVPGYALNTQARQEVGPPLAVSGETLTVLSASDRALAVGLLATANQSTGVFGATYDYLRVYSAVPTPGTLTGATQYTVESTEVLTFTNEGGNQPILIESLVFTGDNGFSYQPYVALPYSLAPGEDFEVEVSFDGPTTAYGFLDILHDGANGPLTSVSLTGMLPVVGTSELYLNCGGPALTLDGISWAADQYSLNGRVFSTSKSIAGTTSDQLYQTERYNSALAYAIPVEDGTYSVTLHFADIYSGTQGVGKRVFNVNLENQEVLTNFDIFATAGGYTALTREFTVTVVDGVLNLVAESIVENPKLSAIAIMPVSSCQPGALCDDGDACTDNDTYGSDCNCAGTPIADSDGDGVCDAEDVCAGFDDALIGTACDDGDACTDNDIYGSDCNCAGTPVPDSDGDGVCDAEDVCAGFDDALIGTPCDDGDACTDNDSYGSDCNCAGTPIADSDGDGVCDAEDVCAGFDDTLIGTACDDGDACTDNDVYGSDCSCAGIPVPDSDGDGVCDAEDVCAGFDDALIGTSCDDGQACTINDSYGSDCNCAGTPIADSDGDGVCDAEDVCAGFDDALIGTACDDGDACTDNDIYGSDCNCAGTPIADSDGDGVCDAEDVCAGFDDALIGTSCDDGEACTDNDVYGSDCNCAGTPIADSDGDGVCDAEDVCAGFDDALIGTSCDDGDACTENDTYGSDCNCAGTPIADSDGDGVCDAEDVCAGFDDALIGTSCDDGDACTENDIYGSDCNCAGTPIADSDGDGVCDAEDLCAGFDDGLIGTSCDDGDACTENDTYGSDCNCAGTPIADSDGDGVCDAEDLCAGFDDGLIGTACDDGDASTDNDVYNSDCNCAGTPAQVGNWTYVNDGNNCSSFGNSGSCSDGRHEASYTQIGDRFILFGGRENNGRVNVYNPVTDTWTVGATPPIKLHHFQAIEYHGLALVVGAMTGNFPAEPNAGEIYVYDPLSDQWHVGPDIPDDRERGGAGCLIHNGEVYLVAGTTTGHQAPGWKTWVDKYDPVANTWVTMADAPEARDHFQIAEKNGYIYALAGRRSGQNGVNGATVANVDRYHIASDSWTTLPNVIPTERAGNTLAILGDEIIVIGGEKESGPAKNEVEALNVNNNTWRSLDPLNTGRHGTQAIVNNNNIWIAAGSPVAGGGSVRSQERFTFGSLNSPSLTANNKSDLTGNGSLVITDVGTIAVDNTGGNQAILITGISQSGSTNFTVNPSTSLPVLVAPGDSYTIGVNHSGSNADAASVSISHTGNGGIKTINLSAGNGCSLVGDACDDGDACTDNDVYGSDCNCAGTPGPDSDGDGVCDAEDVCAGFDDALIGTSCDDGDACTENDIYGSDCNCAGTPVPDSDGDGVCDAEDVCAGFDDGLIGTSCDDGQACTINDSYGSDCNCAGTPVADSDGDGVCDAEDVCPGFDDALIGTSCEDGDACTENDIYGSDCNCAGTPVPDSDGDGVCDAEDVCAGFDDALIGTSCDDGEACTENDTYGSDCNCAGIPILDSDGDGVCDAEDVCPGFDDALIGTSCDDGDPCTDNDVYGSDCNCAGVPVSDSDGDGVCDAEDVCAGFDDALIGTSCDDGDACTENDIYGSDCNCAGTPVPDSDGDGVCDAEDVCPGFDDALIGTSCEDGDACTENDIYGSDCNCAGTPVPDSDGDGVCDAEDVCAGFDDTLIGTSCDDGDACTENDVYGSDCNCAGTPGPDSDGDGICDAIDDDNNLPLTELRINCGGPAVSIVGEEWLADVYSLNGRIYSVNKAISGTDADVLYQTERWNAALAYAIPVVNGNYVIELHFADIYTGTHGNGLRVFSVSLEGQEVLTGLDIYSEVGAYAALVKQFAVSVNDGVLDLETTKIIQNPKLSAIRITPGCPLGITCDDGDPCTYNDFYDQDCNCTGTLAGDADDDGVCDPVDVCPGLDDGVVGPDCEVAGLINVTVRARMVQGSNEQLRLRLDGSDVHTWNITGSNFSDYTTLIDPGDYNVRLWFRDNGTDVEVDYLILDGVKYQAEDQVINTSVWQSGSCGGSFSSRMHCPGYIEFTSPEAAAAPSGISGIARAVASPPAAELNLRVYPNPVTERRLTLAFPTYKEGTAVVELFDLNGKRALRREHMSVRGTNRLTVSLDRSLVPGLYLLHFTLHGERVTKRIIVNR